MKLSLPFSISSRLLPELRIGKASIQLEYDLGAPDDEGRTVYRWIIDLPEGENEKSFSSNDLRSGCGGGNLFEGFTSLLSFLEAAGESYRYNGEQGENSGSFPLEVTKWAAQNLDEISLLRLDLEGGGPGLLEE